MCKDLRFIYGAVSESEAENALNLFSSTWDEKYPTVSKIWIRNWENIIPLFDYPADIRKAICTTNAITKQWMLRNRLRNKKPLRSYSSMYTLNNGASSSKESSITMGTVFANKSRSTMAFTVESVLLAALNRWAM